MVSYTLRQTWTVMGVLLNMFGLGMSLSFTSILLPSLLSPDSIITTDLQVASWVASCVGIAGIPGFLASSILMDTYGRKIAHAIVVIPIIVGWLLIYFATNIPILIFGRSLCGLAAGAALSLSAVVIGEYSSPKNRGMFLNLKTSAVCLGTMTVHICGHFFTWKTVALIALIPHVTALIIILTWPESPSWLAFKKRFEESQKSFYWLRGKGEESTMEMEELLKKQEEFTEHPRKSFSNPIYEFCHKFTERNFIKPVIIVCFAGLLLEACGSKLSFSCEGDQIMVSYTLRQIWTVMGVLLNMFGLGMSLSFTSILLPSLLSPDSIITTDLQVASWVASCVGIAGIPGFLASSILMDTYGRKIAHAIVVIPIIVGWLLIYFATNIPILIFGRSLCGLAAGAALSLSAVVIGEYSSPKNRGMFLNLKTSAVCLGTMTVHICGHFFTWKTVALIALIPHVTALIIILTWPESPSWLAFKKRFEESQKSFYWLRGKGEESTMEVEELLKKQEEFTEHPRKSFSNPIYEFCHKFTERNFIKPVIIVCFAGLLLEACGRHIFPAYALQIIEQVTTDKSQSFYYTIGIDIIITASSLFSSVLVKMLKRRTLLFGSGFAALFVLFCVCSYLLLSAKNIISNERPWIPIMLFAVYFILSNLGCAPIPLALLGEIFPLAHRGSGSFVSGILLSIYLMVSLKVMPYLLVSVKVYGTFAVFGTLMGVALVALYFLLPETKDKTLQQIENYFNIVDSKNKNIENDEVTVKMLSNLKKYEE